MIVNPMDNVIFNTQSDLSDFSFQTGVSNPWLPVVLALKPSTRQPSTLIFTPFNWLNPVPSPYKEMATGKTIFDATLTATVW